VTILWVYFAFKVKGDNLRVYNFIFEDTDKLNDSLTKYNIIDNPNILIQIFSGIIDENLIKDIVSSIKKYLPSSHIVGSTTAGEILDGKMLDKTITISISVFEKTVVQSKFYKDDELNDDSFIDKVFDSLVVKNTKVLIIFSDGLKSNGEEIIKKISSKNKNIIIAGGRAGDNNIFNKTFVFSDNDCSQNGFVAASLSSDILNIHNDYILYWNTIGQDMVVTNSQDNILNEINHKKVIDIYKHYLGDDVANTLPNSGIEFPLIFQQDSVPIARAPVAVLPNGSLLFGGNIPVGTKVKFGFGNVEDIKNKSFERFESIRKHPAQAIFIYSCSARKALVQKDLEIEFSILKSIAPTSGFFTYGEYFHTSNSNELLNITTTFLALSEDNNTPIIKDKLKPTSNTNTTLNALTHLVNITSKEINELNHKLNEAQAIVHLGSWEWTIKTNELWWSDEIYNIFYLNKNNTKLSYEIFESYIHKDDKKIVQKAISNSIYNDDGSYLVEHRIVLKNNEIKTLKQKGTVIKNSDGKALKIIGTVQDITEFKKREDELKELKQKAEQAMMAKSRFLANMSHEIRTPLNAIIGFTDILKDDNLDTTNREHYINIIEKSSSNLLHIINDILDFSKIETGKIVIEKIPFNLKDELSVSFDMFKSLTSAKNITLHIDISSDIPKYIITDPLRLKQVIINLLSNAVKFTKNGNSIFCNITYTDKNLKVVVKDQGIGIPKDKLKSIFNPFSQAQDSTTRVYGGTGLGLTISNDIAKLLGSQDGLKVQSVLGKGSIFEFVIPINIASEVKKGKNISSDIKFQNKKILLVEDNETNQIFMKIVLNKLCIEFDIAADGVEAVDMFKQNSYDLILMDENMPNMNGIEATKKILKLEKETHAIHTPIVALTANAIKGDREKFLSVGMDEYLSKPVKKEQLTTVFKQFFRI